RLIDCITTHVMLPHPALSALIACWITNTYTYKSFGYCGYLSIQSATPRCGKTVLLEVLSGTAKGTPPILTNPTAAVLFRSGLEVWASLSTDRLKETYATLPKELPELSGLDDRLQDISEPLVILAKSADAERPEGRLILPRLLEGLSAAAGRREPSDRERSLVA